MNVSLDIIYQNIFVTYSPTMRKVSLVILLDGIHDKGKSNSSGNHDGNEN